MEPETVRPALYDWAPPHGREPEPPPLDAALAAFEGAREAAGRDEWEEAANEFLAAAALVPMLEHRYAANLAAMREISYRNAALAWSATREGDAGRSALLAAAERDPAHAALLRELAATL